MIDEELGIIDEVTALARASEPVAAFGEPAHAIIADEGEGEGGGRGGREGGRG